MKTWVLARVLPHPVGRVFLCATSWQTPCRPGLWHRPWGGACWSSVGEAPRHKLRRVPGTAIPLSWRDRGTCRGCLILGPAFTQWPLNVTIWSGLRASTACLHTVPSCSATWNHITASAPPVAKPFSSPPRLGASPRRGHWERGG